jgi:acetolactate synthase-1/2/3 large subunit
VSTTGAQSLISSLEAAGVEVIFGIPGGAILPAYDPILESPIRHILMRHEQGAGHAAEGYAQVTGRAGVCMATSGPGATNLVTPLADAYMDSVPMVAITGQVPRPSIGNDAFQEADITGITMPITKHSYKVMDPAEIPTVIAEAFHIATTGRPGPVLVDIPKDVLQEQTSFEWPSAIDLPGYRPTPRPQQRFIRAAADLIRSARRPVIYAGGGIVKGRASEELLRLAEATGAPVVTTLMARGAFPDMHPQCLGMPGMHGNYTAITALQKADLLITLGARFDDRDVPIVGDSKAVITELTKAVLHDVDHHGRSDLSSWWGQIAMWQKTHPLKYEQADDGPIKPQFVIDRFDAALDGEGIVVTGVGQHQMWASQYFRRRHPNTFISSGGLGTMGFAVPAALGAKVARPDLPVVAIDGDGCFQMTAQELATASIEKIPMTIAILNNQHLGMVKQWQTLFYDERYSEVHLPQTPDYVKLVEAYGGIGLRATSPEEVEGCIDKALGVDDRPCVIDFRVDPNEMCFPIVPAGMSNDDVILGPNGETADPTAPVFADSSFGGSDFAFGGLGA